jgi:hypothetical protein
MIKCVIARWWRESELLDHSISVLPRSGLQRLRANHSPAPASGGDSCFKA